METFILFTVKSSLCLASGYLFYYLLLRHETFHRLKRFVLLGIILASLVVPLLRLKVAPAVMTFPVQQIESVLKSEPPVQLVVKSVVQTPVRQEERDRVSLVVLLYLLGASVQVSMILYSLFRIILILGKSKKVYYLGTRVAVVQFDIVPCCFGRRIILSEKDFRKHGREVILHELTHMEKFHSLDLFISELYMVMTWYNPLSWLIRHEMKQNHEFEADRNVLRQGVDISDYQLLLVKTIAGEPRFKLANQFNQSNLKTRITMMNKRKSNPGAILKVLIFIPLVALMVQVFAQKEVEATAASSGERTHTKYLEFTKDQLRILGFETTSSGLYYKNVRFGNPEKGILCLYFTAKTYSGSIILKKGEPFPTHSPAEKVLMKQALLNYDYYPVVVAGYNGFRTQDMMAAEKDPNAKLLPIQVNMAELKLGKRSDTLVFWFTPTPALIHAIAPFAKAADYLQPCPPSPVKPALKPNK